MSLEAKRRNRTILLRRDKANDRISMRCVFVKDWKSIFLTDTSKT